MNSLPDTGFVRLSQILGNPKAQPPIPPIIPVKASYWWSQCRAGNYPAPIRLGRRLTVWRVEDIRALVERIGAAGS